MSASPIRTARRLALGLALGLALAASAFAAPAATSASCALLPDAEDAWRQADAVFLGTVTAVENNARWAKVAIEEVWIGPDQPAEVVVRGGPADAGTASSVDRQFEVGIRYLFAVQIVEGNLEDNACSPTAVADTVDLDAMRPADARPVDATSGGTEGPGGPDLAGLAGPAALVGGIGLLLLLAVLVGRRREA